VMESRESLFGGVQGCAVLWCCCFGVVLWCCCFCCRFDVDLLRF